MTARASPSDSVAACAGTGRMPAGAAKTRGDRRVAGTIADKATAAAITQTRPGFMGTQRKYKDLCACREPPICGRDGSAGVDLQLSRNAKKHRCFRGDRKSTR